MSEDLRKGRGQSRLPLKRLVLVIPLYPRFLHGVQRSSSATAPSVLRTPAAHAPATASHVIMAAARGSWIPIRSSDQLALLTVLTLVERGRVSRGSVGTPRWRIVIPWASVSPSAVSQVASSSVVLLLVQKMVVQVVVDHVPFPGMQALPFPVVAVVTVTVLPVLAVNCPAVVVI